MWVPGMRPRQSRGALHRGVWFRPQGAGKAGLAVVHTRTGCDSPHLSSAQLTLGFQKLWEQLSFRSDFGCPLFEQDTHFSVGLRALCPSGPPVFWCLRLLTARSLAPAFVTRIPARSPRGLEPGLRHSRGPGALARSSV